MATLISWTDETWNPTTGCSKISEGCRYCYAEGLSLRFGWSKKAWTTPHETENVICHPERLNKPYTWKKPSRVFVNSMSDLFHRMVPDEFIGQTFAVMANTPQHTYQILTKRPERAADWPGPWPENIWMGTSVEDQRVVSRIDEIRRCGAQTKFLSCEPMIGPIDYDMSGIDWVICGGESGRHMTPGNPRWLRMEWARHLRDISEDAGAAFFFKQDSGIRTEMRPWLVEEDGSCWEWHQYPGHHPAPVRVNTAA